LEEESPSLLDFISLRSEIAYSVEVETKKKPLSKSKWMKEVVLDSEKYVQIKKKLRELKFHIVCEEAQCPKLDEG